MKLTMLSLALLLFAWTPRAQQKPQTPSDGLGAGKLGPATATRRTIDYWRSCLPIPASTYPHNVDTVPSPTHGFVYVDNVKAGSSTIRSWLHRIKGGVVHWEGGKGWDAHGHLRRVNTGHHPALYDIPPVVWSIVRDPVAKFESGVLQAKVRNPRLQNMSMDEMLLEQISRPYGHWMNEHLEPSTWRLSGFTSTGKLLNVTTIGKLEHLHEDLVRISESFTNLTQVERANLAKPLTHRNSKKHNNDSLSAGAITKMCRSVHYKDEWRCFGYPLPDVCKN